MKKILIPILLMFTILMSAQKKPSVALHYSLTDFETLLNNHLSKLSAMNAGYGLSYWHGISRHLDLNATLNYSSSVYTFPVSSYSTNEKLFTFEAKGIYKILAEDSYAVTPYLLAGAGMFSNIGKVGLYIPVGLGIHLNLKNEAFVFAESSYRFPMSGSSNKSLLFSIGVGTPLFREKKAKPIPIPIVPPPIVEPTPVTKTVAIWVKDEATGVPLPKVEVSLTAASGRQYTGKTDEDGRLNLIEITKADYGVKGVLHDVITESNSLQASMFDNDDPTISLILIHNDPRFTLVGKAVKKKGGEPVSGVSVSVNNKHRASLSIVDSGDDGFFEAQLEAQSNFSISGKKAGFISNIEEMSTMGLKRSETLYVKLELEIEEAKTGKQIVMNKIFFEIGKADLNTVASTDLDKLVKYLKDNTTARLEIQGHTDNTGSTTINNRLSQDRAQNVVSFLIRQGVNKSRLSAKGYGSSQPIDTNNTIEGRANNRRVEVKILGE